MGRKPLGDSPLTPAQRQALQRQRKAEELQNLRSFQVAVQKLADKSRLSEDSIKKALETLVDEFTPIFNDEN